MRGAVIQRVLVEGWSPGRAAAACGVSVRQVNRWVARYRRYGMASLRDVPQAEAIWRRWLRRLRLLISGFSVDKRHRAAEPIPILAPRPNPDGNEYPDRRQTR